MATASCSPDTIRTLYRGCKTAALLALLTPPITPRLAAIRIWLIVVCFGMFLAAVSLLAWLAQAAGLVKPWR